MKILQIFFFSGLALNDCLYIYHENKGQDYESWKKEVLLKWNEVLISTTSWVEEYEYVGGINE